MRISDWSSDVCSSDLCGSAAFEIHLADALAQRFNIDLGHRVILSILTLLSPARFLNKSLDAAVTRFTMSRARLSAGCSPRISVFVGQHDVQQTLGSALIPTPISPTRHRFSDTKNLP